MSTTTSPLRTPFLGRAWKLVIRTQAGPTVVLSNEQDGGLEVTFDIVTRLGTAYWQTQVNIFNANLVLQNQLMATGVSGNQLQQFDQPYTLGDSITISAGYKYGVAGAFNPDANVVFVGSIFQPMWTRVNVKDRKLTLRCTLGYIQDALNPVNFSMAAGASQSDVLSRLSSDYGMKLGDVDTDTLDQKKSPRGQNFTNTGPYAIVQQIARANNMFAWLGASDGAMNLRSLKFDLNTVPTYVYVPKDLPGVYTNGGTSSGLVKQTLIGTPEQTQDGIICRVLMDAQPRIGDIIQIPPQTSISRLPFQIGQRPALTAQNGLYVINSIRHVGNTRGTGDDWATEIGALSSNFFGNFDPGELNAPNLSGN